MCVPRTCYCDDTINWALGSRGCIALVEHATKGKKHAEKVALRRYLHNIKLKIMLNVYELVCAIFIWMFYYLFGWEMRHLHTGGSCPVVSGQGCVIMTSFGPSLGRLTIFSRLLPMCVCFRGSAPDPAGGLTAPPDPQLGKIVHPEKSVTYFFPPNDMPAMLVCS